MISKAELRGFERRMTLLWGAMLIASAVVQVTVFAIMLALIVH